ncbi:hypothetical protein IJS77_04565 [bacterium]|nr:hypothetical protein [bacterium]
MRSVSFNSHLKNCDNFGTFRNYDKLVQRCVNCSTPDEIRPQPSFQNETRANIESSLITKGLKSTVSDFTDFVIRHPMSTLAIIAGSTVTLATLPFLGINMSTGGIAIAAGGGSIAAFNFAKNINREYQNLKNNNYKNIQNDFRDTGCDIVDFSLKKSSDRI